MGTEGTINKLSDFEELKRALAIKDQEIEKLKVYNYFMETLFDGIDEEI